MSDEIKKKWKENVEKYNSSLSKDIYVYGRWRILHESKCMIEETLTLMNALNGSGYDRAKNNIHFQLVEMQDKLENIKSYLPEIGMESLPEKYIHDRHTHTVKERAE